MWFALALITIAIFVGGLVSIVRRHGWKADAYDIASAAGLWSVLGGIATFLIVAILLTVPGADKRRDQRELEERACVEAIIEKTMTADNVDEWDDITWQAQTVCGAI